jgi:hypothetical protein
MIEGGCECGSVRYEVDGAITDLSHCHCAQCRRLHGAAFASFGGIVRDKFRYLSGASDVESYASSETSDRKFCRKCGSNILVDFKPEPEVLYLTMGTVDGQPDCPPGYHQFVGSKAPWYEIHDEMPQHDAWPPD